MIQVQEIVNRGLSILDAEGSDRYIFNRDFKPAINDTIEWLVSAFNKVLSENKLSEEALSDLTKTKIFQANQFSRIFIDESQLGHKVWSLLAVMPDPEVYPSAQPPAQATPERSVYRPDLSFVKSSYSADRITVEQRNENRENVFMPGNETLQNKLKTFSYVSAFNYGSSNYAQNKEIEILPSVAGKFVAISYLKRPNLVSVVTDTVEFPESLTNVIVQKMLNFVSTKQGDRTNLFSISDKETRTLIQLMS